MVKNAGTQDVRMTQVRFVIGADFMMDILNFVAVLIGLQITEIAMAFNITAIYLVINA